MVVNYGISPEDETAMALLASVKKEPGMRQEDVVRFVASRMNLEILDVLDMLGWLIQEDQIVRRGSSRGLRLYPAETGFAVRKVLPPPLR